MAMVVVATGMEGKENLNPECDAVGDGVGWLG